MTGWEALLFCIVGILIYILGFAEGMRSERNRIEKYRNQNRSN